MYLRNERTKPKSKHSIHNRRRYDEQLPKEPNVSEADDFMQCQTQNKDGVAIVFGGGNENWLTSELVVRKGNNVKSWKKERYYIIFSFDKCEFA